MMLNKLSSKFSRWIQDHLTFFLALVLTIPAILRDLWVCFYFGGWSYFPYLLVGSLPNLAVIVFFVWCLSKPTEFLGGLERSLYKGNNQRPVSAAVASGALAVVAFLISITTSVISMGLSGHSLFPSLGTGATAVFLMASYTKVLEVRTKPAVEVSNEFLMIASAYYCLEAFFGRWSADTLVLYALAFVLAFLAFVESRKYLSLVRKAYEKSEPSYQVEPYIDGKPAGLLPLLYYSNVSYDGVLYRVDGDLNDPFRSQQSKLPLASIPLKEERTFLSNLQARWAISALLLFAAGVGFLLNILGGRFVA